MATINNMNIDKALTYMMVPFYYEGDFLSVGNLWQQDNNRELKSEDADYLYPHIMYFLKGKMVTGTSANSSLTVYRLNEKSEDYRSFWKKFASKIQSARIDDNLNIDFKFIEGTKSPIFGTPHLFVSEEGNVGLLTFGIGQKCNDIQQLKQLNYHLHKIQQPLGNCISKGMKLNEKVPESAKEKVKAELNFAYNAFYNRNASDEEMAAEFIWNMKMVTSFFLQDIKGCKKMRYNNEKTSIKLFSPPRIHLFTFCTIDDSANNQIQNEDVIPELLKLSRCVNDKYMLANEQLDKENGILKTFDNIYIASSVEGTAMIAVAKEGNKGFISSMDQALERYLWVYLMSLIQRFSLLNLDRRLSQINEGDTSNLLSVMKVVSVLKSHCSYAEVSPFAQHNQFYKYCSEKLNIFRSYEEIVQKTGGLNLLFEQRAEWGQRRLNLLVGVLTVFQVADVIFTFTNKEPYDDMVPSIITLAVGGIIIALIYLKNILSFLKLKR